MGINVNPGPEIQSWLKDAGFENITTRVFKPFSFYPHWTTSLIFKTYSRNSKFHSAHGLGTAI